MARTNKRRSTKHLSLQKQADNALKKGDLERAYRLFCRAVGIARKNSDQYEDATFFTEAKALECLEKLIDAGRPEFLKSYVARSGKFFREWGEEQITRRIQPKQRRRAMAFLAWRARYWALPAEFYVADNAAKHGAYDVACRSMQALLEKLELVQSPDSVALTVIVKARLGEFAILEDLRSVQAPDVLAAANRHKNLADECRLSSGSISKWRFRVDGARERLMSLHFRLRASAVLRAPLRRSLVEAEELLRQAVSHARKALGKWPGKFTWMHLARTRFRHLDTLEREKLERFMEDGRQQSYDATIKAHDELEILARKLASRVGESHLFPDRYYSLKDLESGRKFLESASAFKRGELSTSASLLEDLLAEFPKEYEFSWRHSQIRLRCLVVKGLIASRERRPDELSAICAEANKLRFSEPIGAVGRFLANELVSLPMKGSVPLTIEYLDMIARLFPLDAFTESYDDPGAIPNSLLSLPQRIHDWLTQTNSPSTELEVQEFKVKLLGATEAFLGYAWDYHSQIAGFAAAQTPECDADLSFYVRNLAELPALRKEGKNDLVSFLSTLKDEVAHLRESTTPSAYRDAYVKIRLCITKLMKLFPVVVEIENPGPYGDVTQAKPDWLNPQLRPSTARLFFGGVRGAHPGWYFLPPKWRKGNRITFNIKGNQTLIPVRYRPDWQLWENDSANSSLLLGLGVRFSHLRRAIELAQMCKNTEDKPKVGAVITKGGEKVAEAYRGEDDTDRHAEEIAMSKCTKWELKDSVVVTTLEPCTHSGRTAANASCATLIVQNEVGAVVIGVPDPNPAIRGRGDQQFRMNGISVGYFPPELSGVVWQMNRPFIEKHTKDDFRAVYLQKSDP